VQRESFFTAMQDDLPRPELRKVTAANSDQIPRPEDGQHACACHFEAHFTGAASHSRNQLAPNSSALRLSIHTEWNLGCPAVHAASMTRGLYFAARESHSLEDALVADFGLDVGLLSN
jgi:hypothetical protein